MNINRTTPAIYLDVLAFYNNLTAFIENNGRVSCLKGYFVGYFNDQLLVDLDAFFAGDLFKVPLTITERHGRSDESSQSKGNTLNGVVLSISMVISLFVTVWI